MVEAKLDAEKTISAYRDELEAKYSAAHTAITGNASSTSSDLDAQVVTDISSMQSEFTLRQAAMEDALVDLVCKVEVKPRPARGK